MKKQAFCNFILAGTNITEFGLKIPSSFCSLDLNNSEITSFTSWTLKCVVGGDSKNKINIAAFEALLYSAAQSANSYKNSSGIPVSFMFGWLDEQGNVDSYSSYQGFTLQFDVSTSGLYMTYNITGFASLSVQTSMPILNIPEISGIVQPSAVLEALAKASKITNYYQLDIDHNDAPTLVQHGALNTSFNKYVRGSYSGEDNYTEFPGLLKLSKSYNASREAAGIQKGYKSLSQIINNVVVSPLSSFLKKGLNDNTPQCCSFSYWIDEPTMTQPGIIHYKSNSSLMNTYNSDTLEYGTANTNVISISGSYKGVAYNMTNMNFSSIGFDVDGSGNTVVQDCKVVNSWSSSLADTFQTVNIINDINAIASQFSGDFTVTVPGTVKDYKLAQPVSLIVLSGNTLSPISGVYNIMSVSQSISNIFITTLKLKRLVMSSANQVAAGQGITVNGLNSYTNGSMKTTKNIISTGKVDFGTMYPDFTYIQQM